MELKIGPYQILRSIAKGGMGEVLLAYDPTFERHVALKRIRSDLKAHLVLKNRFLREAKITGQLTHPGVIAIYSIHHENDEIYYTMPYVEGETFRGWLRKDPPPSIPALMPIFSSICQTVAYTHSKGIIHRDLKPENILVGKFGEVVILDWGLAQLVSEPHEEGIREPVEHQSDLTHPGKIVGTLAFMAPERAQGLPANIQSDIYALGIILYQILTLQLPFERSSIKELRKNYHLEKFLDPEEVAPYRDVPPRLSRIVKKCLEIDPKNRYQSMDELLHDLKSFLEGRSEWFETARLDIHRKKDWEFQENLLISKHIAITRTTEEAEWVSIMLSQAAFTENIRLQTNFFIGENGRGIGFLLSVPEDTEREHPFEGYCLWLAAEEFPSSRLFRNSVEVMQLPDFVLKKNHWHSLAIEKVDNNIHIILDGTRRYTYLSYLPLAGTHVGVMARDADFQMENIAVFIGNQNLQISCLSIPDAFLATKDYKRALAEYRRIGYSFPGHAEGREALFRAGITLLEQAKVSKTVKKAQSFFSLALEEFGKLHRTPGAPLEYLGKSLVYQALKDNSEEIKCLELALRRYQKHPLSGAIKEQILYRMHESSQKDRRSAYQLILLALRHLPEVLINVESQRLFKHLITHWETLPFLENPIEPSTLGKEMTPREAKLNEIQFSIPLAFWLATPFTFVELFEDLFKMEIPDPAAIGNAIFSLFEMGSINLARQWMRQIDIRKEAFAQEQKKEMEEILALLSPLFISVSQSPAEATDAFFALRKEDIGLREFRTLSFICQQALKDNQEEVVHRIAAQLLSVPLSLEDRVTLDGYEIWAYLQEENLEGAEALFDRYSFELLNQESTLLHPLYGCWLRMTEGEEISQIYFSGVIDTPFPRSWALLGHELSNHITENPAWFNTSFLWERRRLYRQLTLYYQAAENPELEAHYRDLEKKEYVNVPD